MSELVKRLADGSHPVEVSLRPDRSVRALKERLDRGYVHVKFTSTRGGTELGLKLDRDRTATHGADFDRASGSVTLVGSLSLDFVSVTCVAEIDLATLAGTGHLEIVSAPETVS